MFKYTQRYFSQFLKNIWHKNKLQFLILFVTTKCNCRCSGCFYWSELNRNVGDLKIGEIKKVSNTIGNIRTLLISGGEPFLRKDLFELCSIFIEKNKISTLSIPTNCSQGECVVDFAQKILNRYPNITLSINPSLDGFKDTHDKLRGLDGIFEQATETINKLQELKKIYPNLEITVNTVISRSNLPQLKLFMDFVYDNFKGVNFHEFELLRGDWRDKTMHLPDPAEIENIHHQVVRNTERYLKRNKASIIEHIAVIGLLLFIQRLKMRHITGGSGAFVCSAGKNIGVVDANGDVKLCELMPAVGNLRDAGFNFKTIWNSTRANQERIRIKNKKCSCTHVCFLKLTASSHFKSIFYLLRYYLLYKMK